MRNTKTNIIGIVSVFLCFHFCFCGFAQNRVAELVSEVKMSRSGFDYSYIFKRGNTSVSGRGRAVIQGSLFKMLSDDMDVYCSGASKIILDKPAREVFIEPVRSREPDVYNDPALFLSSLDHFDIGIPKQDRFDGRNVLSYILTPGESIHENGSLEYIVVYFEGDLFTGIAVHMNDGSEIVISISNLVFAGLGDETDFTFDISSLGKEWFVNDLT